MILLILKTTRTGRTLISSASSASRTAMSALTSSPTAAAGRLRSAGSSTSSAATLGLRAGDSTVYEAMLNGVWKDKEMVDDKYTGGWFWEVEDLDGRFYICLNVPGEVNV